MDVDKYIASVTSGASVKKKSKSPTDVDAYIASVTQPTEQPVEQPDKYQLPEDLKQLETPPESQLYGAAKAFGEPEYGYGGEVRDPLPQLRGLAVGATETLGRILPGMTRQLPKEIVSIDVPTTYEEAEADYRKKLDAYDYMSSGLENVGGETLDNIFPERKRKLDARDRQIIQETVDMYEGRRDKVLDITESRAKMIKVAETVGNTLLNLPPKEWRDEISEISQQALSYKDVGSVGEFLQRSADILESLTTVASMQVPRMLISTAVRAGATAATGGNVIAGWTAGSYTLAAEEFENFYQRAIAEGIDEDTALEYAHQYAPVSAAIESMQIGGIGRLAGKLTKKAQSKALMALAKKYGGWLLEAVSEGGEELLQGNMMDLFLNQAKDKMGGKGVYLESEGIEKLSGFLTKKAWTKDKIDEFIHGAATAIILGFAAGKMQGITKGIEDKTGQTLSEEQSGQLQEASRAELKRRGEPVPTLEKEEQEIKTVKEGIKSEKVPEIDKKDSLVSKKEEVKEEAKKVIEASKYKIQQLPVTGAVPSDISGKKVVFTSYFAVPTEMQGKGVGTEALKMLEKEAQEKDAEAVVFVQVLKPAESFYISQGYKVDREAEMAYKLLEKKPTDLKQLVEQRKTLDKRIETSEEAGDKKALTEALSELEKVDKQIEAQARVKAEKTGRPFREMGKEKIYSETLGKEYEIAKRAGVTRRAEEQAKRKKVWTETLRKSTPIPIDKITGLEPQPMPKPTSKREITEPIEITITDQGDYILEAGNHRYWQAKFNKDKTIPAKIRYEKGAEKFAPKPEAKKEERRVEKRETVEKVKPETLKQMIGELERGESGKRIKGEDGTLAGYSTNPDWFRDKGYSKVEITRLLNKKIRGVELTGRQQGIYEDIVRDKISETEREAITERAEPTEQEQIEKEITRLKSLKQTPEIKDQIKGLERTKTIIDKELPPLPKKPKKGIGHISAFMPEKSKFSETIKEEAKGIGNQLGSLVGITTTEEGKDVKRLLRKKQAKKAHYRDAAWKMADKRRAWWEKASTDMKLDFIDKYEHGKSAPEDFSNYTDDPELQKTLSGLAKEYWGRMEAQYDKDSKYNPDLSHIDYYMAHMWKNPTKAEKAFTSVSGKIKRKPGFSKKRAIDYIKQGLEYGLELKTTNPEEIVLKREMAGFQYRNTMDFLDEMKERGLMKFNPGMSRPDPGWKALDSKVMKIYFKGKEGLVEAGEYVMPTDAANIVNNYLSPSLWTKEGLGGTTFRSMMRAKNALVGAMLSFSGFHAMETTITDIAINSQVAIRELSRGNLKKGLNTFAQAAISPIKSAALGGKIKKAWYLDEVEFSKQPEWVQNATERLIRAGGRPAMEKAWRIEAIDQIKRAWQSKDVEKMVKAPYISAIVEATAKPIMEMYVPNLKLYNFYKVSQDYVENHLDASPKEVDTQLQKIWDNIDNNFGQLVYDNLFWNRYLRDTMMASTLSLGWNLGSIRQFGGTIADTKKMMEDVKNKKGIKITDKQLLTATYVSTIASVGFLMTYGFTGKPPEELIDLFYPPTGRLNSDGSKERVLIPAMTKDFFALNEAIRKKGLIGGVVKVIRHKASPMISIVGDLLKNKDYFEREIRDPNADLVTQAKQLGEHLALNVVTPFSLRSHLRMRQTDKDSPLNVLPFVGFPLAPRYVSRTKTQAKIEDFYYKDRRTLPKADQEKYNQRFIVANKIKKGEPYRADLKELIDKGYLTSRGKTRFVKMAKTPTDVKHFYYLSKQEQKYVLEFAVKDKKTDINRYLDHAKKDVKKWARDKLNLKRRYANNG